MWINFKYERLPSFCFYCGIIGHSEKFCEALFDSKDEQGSRKYSGSLRAPTKRQTNAGTNHWIRGSGGEKIQTKVEEGIEGGGKGKDEIPKGPTTSQESRDLPRNQGDHGGHSVVNKESGGNIEVFSGGIIVSKQKRQRTKEDSKEKDFEMGQETDTEIGLDMDLDMDLYVEVNQNQKNLAWVGPVGQAHQPQ